MSRRDVRGEERRGERRGGEREREDLIIAESGEVWNDRYVRNWRGEERTLKEEWKGRNMFIIMSERRRRGRRGGERSAAVSSTEAACIPKSLSPSHPHMFITSLLTGPVKLSQR